MCVCVLCVYINPLLLVVGEGEGVLPCSHFNFLIASVAVA